LGLPRIPCICVEHLTGSEQRLLRFALNRLGENGAWSLEDLKVEFEELIVEQTPMRFPVSARPRSIKSCLATIRRLTNRGRLRPRQELSRSPSKATSFFLASIRSPAATPPLRTSSRKAVNVRHTAIARLVLSQEATDIMGRRRGRGPRRAGPGEKEQAGGAETHARAFEDIWLCPRQVGHRCAEILRRRSQSSWNRKTPRAWSMAQQSSGEFASANPTNGEEDASVQDRGIPSKISLNPRSHLQHFQRPTPSDISKNTPSLQGHGFAGVA
jgi:hypothetical protein